MNRGTGEPRNRETGDLVTLLEKVYRCAKKGNSRGRFSSEFRQPDTEFQSIETNQRSFLHFRLKAGSLKLFDVPDILLFMREEQKVIYTQISHIVKRYKDLF